MFCVQRSKTRHSQSESRDKHSPSRHGTSEKRHKARAAAAAPDDSNSESSSYHVSSRLPMKHSHPIVAYPSTSEAELHPTRTPDIKNDSSSRKEDFLEPGHGHPLASPRLPTRSSCSSASSLSLPVFLGDELATSRHSSTSVRSSSASSSSSDCESVSSSNSSASCSSASLSEADTPSQRPLDIRPVGSLAISGATARTLASMTQPAYDIIPPPPMQPPLLEGYSTVNQTESCLPPPPMRPAPCLEGYNSDDDEDLFPLPVVGEAGEVPDGIVPQMHADRHDGQRGQRGGHGVNEMIEEEDENFLSLMFPALDPVQQENRNQLVLDSTGILSPIREVTSETSLTCSAGNHRSKSMSSVARVSCGAVCASGSAGNSERSLSSSVHAQLTPAKSESLSLHSRGGAGKLSTAEEVAKENNPDTESTPGGISSESSPDDIPLPSPDTKELDWLPDFLPMAAAGTESPDDVDLSSLPMSSRTLQSLLAVDKLLSVSAEREESSVGHDDAIDVAAVVKAESVLPLDQIPNSQ